LKNKSLRDQLTEAFGLPAGHEPPDEAGGTRVRGRGKRGRARAAERRDDPAPGTEPGIHVVPGVFSVIDRAAVPPRVRYTAPAPAAASAPPAGVPAADTRGVDTWELHGLVDRMFRPRVAAAVAAPELDRDDVRLALCWFASLERQEARDPSAKPRPRDWDLDQLLSARAAEIVAERFYRRMGLDTRNVSLGQILDPRDPAWTFYDLRAGGALVDVKNARRPETRSGRAGARMRYAEHCVSRFKEVPEGQEVRIAGVLSHRADPAALPALQALMGVDTRALFLGELSPAAYRALVDRYEDGLLEGIGGGRPEELRTHFIPVWLYDYPEPVYRDRDGARAACAALLPRVDWDAAALDPAPISLATGVDLGAAVLGMEEDGWELAFYRRLLRHGAGDSLPVLFLEVLRHFLGMVARGDSAPASYRPAGYRRLLFREGSPAPLGIHDPLATVRNLVQVLDALWTGRQADGGDRMREYRIFKLSGTGVLRGRVNAHAPWDTLAAYCGHCGEDPLLIHACGLCQPHRRLVCQTCGRCSAGCTERPRAASAD
jgi:hypothetical protein